MLKEEQLSPPTRTMFVRVDKRGAIATNYAGETSDGEGNVPEAARLVVLLLNEWHEGWSEPHRPVGHEGGADMIADGPLGRLNLQITRVPRDPALWRSAAREGRISRTAQPEEYAADLMNAIRHKADRYSLDVRQSTMLVLDGQRSMAFDCPPVLHAFTAAHLAEARQCGFDDIFLLGAVRFVNLLQPQELSAWITFG